MRLERILKRKKLIKKLFKEILKDKKVNQIRFGVIDRDSRQFNRLYGCSYAKHSLTGDRHIISINLLSLRDRIKNGYSNEYYINRHEKLNFVIGNFKLALRFVILHELAHCILKEQGKNSELNVDNYAIEQLQKEGFLKTNSQKYIPDWSCD